MAAMNASVPPRADSVAAAGSESDLVSTPAAGPAALRGSVLRSAAYAASVGLSLISAPLLIRHLGIGAFGRYTTVVALVTIVGGLTDGGLVTIAMREWATRVEGDRTRVMRSLLGIRLELSAAGVAIGVGFAFLAGYDGTLVLGTLLAGVGMVLQVTANLLTASLQGDLRFGWASFVDLARQSVSVAVILALVLAGSQLLPFLAATIPAGLAALALTAVLARGRMPLHPRLRGEDRWRLLRETLPYAAAIAVNTVYFRVTIVVMSLVASATQTGYFATSFRVTEVLVGIPAIAIGAAFPILSRVARSDEERFAFATDRILELALLAGTGLVLTVVLSAPFVIDVLAGPRGAPAAPVLQIQGVALLATFVAVATGYALLSLRRHSALLIANSAALVANIVLTLALVPVARAEGAAIAAVVAESCLAVAQLILLLQAGAVRVSISMLRAVGIAGLLGAAPLLVAVHPLIRGVLGLTVFVLALAAQGRLPPELLHVLERRDR